MSTDEENDSDDEDVKMESRNEVDKEKDVVPSVEKLKPKQNLTGPTFAPKREPGKVKRQPKLDKSEIKEVGNWEKYEKGFGSKMLMKMGWQKGMGLGKEGQGRAVPVEATLRKGKCHQLDKYEGLMSKCDLVNSRQRSSWKVRRRVKRGADPCRFRQRRRG